MGDTVYVLGQYTADIAEFTVVSFNCRLYCYNANSKCIEKEFIAKNSNSILTVAFMENNIGEWVFLSRAEAEKKLKGEK